MDNEIKTLGAIIDMSLEDFDNELKRQKVNVGVINGLILNLKGAYANLTERKDALMKSVTEDKSLTDKDIEERKKVIESIYAELIKLEQKILFLKQKSEELLKGLN